MSCGRKPKSGWSSGTLVSASHSRPPTPASSTLARAALHEDWNLDDLRETLRCSRYPIVGVERHLLGYPPASHAIVVVQITSRAVHVLDPVEGPQPQRYGREAFVLAWQMAGHDALVVEAPPSRPTL